jgi:glycosyltransferase involved in cell wall biosynthesis
MAMKHLQDIVLLIVGSGDVITCLKDIVEREKLHNKVILTGKVPQEKLKQYTVVADLGVTLDKPTNINYRFSLPNKVFDYIHAGIPVLCSNLPEVARIVRDYQVGVVIDTFEPEKIADAIRQALSSRLYPLWESNTLKAGEELCWETDEVELKRVYSKFM